MKKTENKDNNKKVLTIGGLSALCIAALVGVYFLTREPENEFVPASTETGTTTDTWGENADMDALLPDDPDGNTSQVTGTVSDNTQEVISEDESGTVSSLSGSTTKEDSTNNKPVEKPKTTDDTTNPTKQPEYDNDIPQTPDNDNNTSPADDSSNPHPGQVYDPVFGWLDPGNTNQDTVDSDGDISKQIGTMD